MLLTRGARLAPERNRSQPRSATAGQVRVSAPAASSFTGVRLAEPSDNGYRWSASWVENSAKVMVAVPVEEAWTHWQHKADIPKWMPWISAVETDSADPRVSRWVLATTQFGQRLEFSWTAKDLTPLALQKMHWASQDGLSNRGAVRFVRKGDSACEVSLSIAYEIPDVLMPFGAAVVPLVENIISADLVRFKDYAVTHRVRQNL